jgi:drug/metabolite transporter (DMT)-like permease
MVKVTDWALFVVLSLVWGSSFVLMLEGLKTLDPYQVAALRILAAGMVLLPFSVRAFRQIPIQKMGWVFITGLLGNFIPAFLFCIAETRISSSLAGILNALTPLFTVVLGIAFFRLPVNKYKIAGTLLGFAGLVLLPFASLHIVAMDDLRSVLLVVLATLCYGLNVNIVGRYLKGVRPLQIASAAFAMLIVPCLGILWANGFFSKHFSNVQVLRSLAASCGLGIMGTAVASVLFYRLVESAGAVFASLVTYGIPVVAILWGLVYGETFRWQQAGCLLIILAGVYATRLRDKNSKGS